MNPDGLYIVKEINMASEKKKKKAQKFLIGCANKIEL